MVQELQQRLMELAARRTPTRPAAPPTPPAAPDAAPMDADGDGDGGQCQLPSTIVPDMCRVPALHLQDSLACHV